MQLSAEKIIELLLLFGLQIIAFLVLVFSVIFARWLAVVIIGGIVALVLMVAEVALWVFMAGVGSATSGSQEAYRIPIVLAIISFASLVAYIPIALLRWRRFRSRHLARGSPT